MFLLFGAFIAGMLTVLAPCVLPLLPIIIGGSVTGDTKDRKRPLLIAASLAVSLFVFTMLLKATTLLISIPPRAISYVSGVIIIVLGVVTLFPNIYARVVNRLGIEQRAQQALGVGFRNRSEYLGPLITGAALGPVFSSCSPVYAYILATVLPGNFGQAVAYVISYIVGLSLVLLLIGFFGQKFTSRIKFASNPNGAFQRVIAILFIVVGLLIISGYDKRFQTYVSVHTPFNFDAVSSKLLPNAGPKTNGSGVLNVSQPFQAPEFTGIAQWLNGPPQTISGLKGKVVYVDFWTYSCINCIRNNPYIEKWHQTYHADGFEVIGVHAPEFAFERLPANVQKAIKDQHISYPVALDNDFSTWNAYQNESWPAGYLIDATGKVRRIHAGEGEYEQTEQAIRQLLTENGKTVGPLAGNVQTTAPISAMQTPETYLGFKRASNYSGSPALGAAGATEFTGPPTLSKNHWALDGGWQVTPDKITATGNSRLRFHVSGKDVYVVGGAASPASMEVLLDGKPISTTGNAGADVHGSKVMVDQPQLYKLAHFSEANDSHTLELHVPAGVSLNVFTFGSQ